MQIDAAPMKLCQRAPAEDAAFCSSSDCHPEEVVTHSLGPERGFSFLITPEKGNLMIHQNNHSSW